MQTKVNFAERTENKEYMAALKASNVRGLEKQLNKDFPNTIPIFLLNSLLIEATKVSEPRLDLIKMLVERGAKAGTSYKDRDQDFTPLHNVLIKSLNVSSKKAQHEGFEIAKLLDSKGASFERSGPTPGSSDESDKVLMLHLAIRESLAGTIGATEFVNQLVAKHKTPIKGIDSEFLSSTPLAIALEEFDKPNSNRKLVQAVFNISAEDLELAYAARDSKKFKVSGDINRALIDGDNALLIAVKQYLQKKGSLEFVEFLLQNGAKVDSTSKEGATPLQLSMQPSVGGDGKLVKLLMDYKASLVINGSTPYNSIHFWRAAVKKRALKAEAAHYDTAKSSIEKVLFLHLRQSTAPGIVTYYSPKQGAVLLNEAKDEELRNFLLSTDIIFYPEAAPALKAQARLQKKLEHVVKHKLLSEEDLQDAQKVLKKIKSGNPFWGKDYSENDDRISAGDYKRILRRARISNKQKTIFQEAEIKQITEDVITLMNYGMATSKDRKTSHVGDRTKAVFDLGISKGVAQDHLNPIAPRKSLTQKEKERRREKLYDWEKVMTEDEKRAYNNYMTVSEKISWSNGQLDRNIFMTVTLPGREKIQKEFEDTLKTDKDKRAFSVRDYEGKLASIHGIPQSTSSLSGSSQPSTNFTEANIPTTSRPNSSVSNVSRDVIGDHTKRVSTSGDRFSRSSHRSLSEDGYPLPTIPSGRRLSSSANIEPHTISADRLPKDLNEANKRITTGLQALKPTNLWHNNVSNCSIVAKEVANLSACYAYFNDPEVKIPENEKEQTKAKMREITNSVEKALNKFTFNHDVKDAIKDHPALQDAIIDKNKGRSMGEHQ